MSPEPKRSTDANPITDNLDLWSSATKKKAAVGRGKNSKTSPHGINKLRELILELAVRGKLVLQDPSDEPARVLLEKIAAEKEQLIKDKKIKKQKPLPPMSDEEKPFELPEGWEWAKFQLLATSYSVGLDRGKNQQGSNKQYRYFKMNNILNSGGFDLSDIVTVDADNEEINKYSLKTNDLLFNTRNSKELVGKTCVFEKSDSSPILYNNNILRAQFPASELPYILDTWMRSPSGKLELERIKSGTTNVWAIYQGKLEGLACPVPPKAEQHRIVAKVDELMALCDQLEQQQTSSLHAHPTLVRVYLDRLVDQANTSQTIHTELIAAFDTLFTTEEAIDQLKQTILQLAVMGKLVPQNPNDEPASLLLEKIAAEKEQLIKDKKIKKQKPLPPISDEEKPFDLPEGWEWVRLGNIYTFLNGYAFKSEWFSDKGIKLLRNINIGHGEIHWKDIASLPINMEAEYERFSLNKGDIVISLDRPIINTGLKYAIIKEDDLPCLLLQRVARFHSIGDHMETSFLARWLESSTFIESIDPGRSNGVPHISTKQLEMRVFPVLSKAEQHRIVAKVDELMALCDTLKARLNEAQTTQAQLADAVLEQAI